METESRYTWNDRMRRTPESGSTVMRLSRAELIEKLEARLPEAKALDKWAAKAHAAEEKEWLRNAKAQLREMVKISDYNQMVEELPKLYGYRSGRINQPPKCDTLATVIFESAIGNLRRYDTRRQITITDRNNNAHYWRLLSVDLDPESTWPTIDDTVC